ncbi:hypothetical protein K461DRAFT_313683 [Myriangium duriaei CBS 260.36]|uniref:BTB domain-containing protein n=1 Tax=Myriangium duriaei CBS 260.36 TaxID=1168546 RepID=A0A9P4IYE7_9PEZI|nr:hypothetical protein K461DRAFT_313683 [Myriangium duriaei CBS 260.36]
MPEPRFKSDYRNFLKVLVAKKEPFYAHTAILTRHSPFFRKYLEQDVVEIKKTTEILLPDDDPTVFDHFLDWCYTGKLKFRYLPGANADESPDSTSDMYPLVKLYLFAGKTQTERLKMDIIRTIYDQTPDIKEISVRTCVLVCRSLSPSDGLRQLIERWFVIYGTSDHFSTMLLTKAPDFVHTIISTILQLSKTQTKLSWAFRSLEYYLERASCDRGPMKDEKELVGIHE